MTRFMTVLAASATLMFSGAAQAQPVVTTQASVGGATGNATYSVRVVGADGVSYNCRPNTTTVDGRVARLCQVADGAVGATAGAAAGAGAAGTGAATTALVGGTITVGAAAAAAIVAIAVVATTDDDDGVVSTTTTTGPGT